MSRLPAKKGGPSLPSMKLKPPGWLSKFACEEWYRVVPALEKAGMLTALDETAMVNYVVAYDRFRQAQEVIQEHGFTTHTAAGGYKKRPELQVISEAQMTMRRFMEAFGLTPASRARLNLNPPAEGGAGGRKDHLPDRQPADESQGADCRTLQTPGAADRQAGSRSG